MAKTLAELKAENAKSEQEGLDNTASEKPESKDEAIEVEDQETEQVAESGSDDDEETEIESWKLTDEQQSEKDDRKFSDHDIAAAKKKLKLKLESEKEENESLRAEIEKLKAQIDGGQAQSTEQVQKIKPRPTLESFDYDEEKYANAMSEWLTSQVDTKLTERQKGAELQRQQELQKQNLDKAIDDHLNRAVNLKDSGIDFDTYQNAELNVRRSIETIMPGMGDSITDNLIASIGNDSEKILYQLGVNSKVREEFESKLRSDKSGTKALIYLGELKGRLKDTVKRRSNAPKPAASAEGGESGKTGENALKAKYNKAKSPQERFNIKQQARQAGISKNVINSW